jgi:branched-chain amino acid transport system permease protein
MRSPRTLLVWAVVGIGLVAVPQVIHDSFILDVLILAGLYVAFALTYDLTVGYVGSLSLAHPAFFGIGAYVTGLLATKLHTPIGVNLLAAAGLAAVLAVAVGIPSFRLSEYSFAVGTLGFATVGQVVAQNWIDVTDGPLCVTGIPKPAIFVAISSLPAFYYLMTAAAVLILLFMHRLIGSRIGRSFKAVRENEVMAESVGINPLKYKMLAFCLGAAGAGCVGTLYAYFIGIVCPTDLALTSTLTLLVILFIGGSGSLRGVVLGAILVTALPEFLRIGDQWRLLLYGVALLLIINFLPNGLEGLFHRRSRT